MTVGRSLILKGRRQGCSAYMQSTSRKLLPDAEGLITDGAPGSSMTLEQIRDAAWERLRKEMALGPTKRSAP
jgi:hypothetical protein